MSSFSVPNLIVIFSLSCFYLCQPAHPKVYLDQIAMPSVKDGREGMAAKIDPQCRCGLSPQGSNSENLNDLPWAGALFHKDLLIGSKKSETVMYCGITLINNLYAVTTSRCIVGLEMDDLYAKFSSEKMWSYIDDMETGSQKESKAHITGVEKVINHPEFDDKVLNHDVALVKLKNPVPFHLKRNIRPICLPWNNKFYKNRKSYTGVSGTVAGWVKKGRTSYSLIKNTVPIISNEECNRKVDNGSITIRENMMCADDVGTGAVLSCQSDTGNALTVTDSSAATETTSKQIMLGIVQWLFGCSDINELNTLYNIIFLNSTAKPQIPGVYTRISEYEDFIKQNTLDSVWCDSG